MPSGGALEPEDYERLGHKTRDELPTTSHNFCRLRRSAEADELWRFLYGVIAAAQDLDGLVGSVTARVEAHLLRLGLLYASADASPIVEVDHLEAAWALLCYADDSARFVFGGSLGDPTADRILARLRELPADQGLDGTEQR